MKRLTMEGGFDTDSTVRRMVRLAPDPKIVEPQLSNANSFFSQLPLDLVKRIIRYLPFKIFLQFDAASKVHDVFTKFVWMELSETLSIPIGAWTSLSESSRLHRDAFMYDSMLREYFHYKDFYRSNDFEDPFELMKESYPLIVSFIQYDMAEKNELLNKTIELSKIAQEHLFDGKNNGPGEMMLQGLLTLKEADINNPNDFQTMKLGKANRLLKNAISKQVTIAAYYAVQSNLLIQNVSQIKSLLLHAASCGDLLPLHKALNMPSRTKAELALRHRLALELFNFGEHLPPVLFYQAKKQQNNPTQEMLFDMALENWDSPPQDVLYEVYQFKLQRQKWNDVLALHKRLDRDNQLAMGSYLAVLNPEKLKNAPIEYLLVAMTTIHSNHCNMHNFLRELSIMVIEKLPDFIKLDDECQAQVLFCRARLKSECDLEGADALYKEGLLIAKEYYEQAIVDALTIKFKLQKWDEYSDLRALMTRLPSNFYDRSSKELENVPAEVIADFLQNGHFNSDETLILSKKVNQSTSNLI
jgi:hypothetical protein